MTLELKDQEQGEIKGERRITTGYLELGRRNPKGKARRVSCSSGGGTRGERARLGEREEEQIGFSFSCWLANVKKGGGEGGGERQESIQLKTHRIRGRFSKRKRWLRNKNP